MTLDEKIGQLVQYSAGFATGPGASNLRYDELAAKGQVGSMLNVVGAEATNHYQHIAVEKSRLHIPILFGLDVIHGHRTTFPVPLALAASWDPAAAETVARYWRNGSPRRRHPLGLLAHGGHCPRPALGTHRRVQRRRPLPGLGDGPRLGEGLPAGRSLQARLGRGQREALCRLRRGHRRARLQRRGHERDYAAPGVPGALSRRGRGRRGHADEFLQLHQRRSRLAPIPLP